MTLDKSRCNLIIVWLGLILFSSCGHSLRNRPNYDTLRPLLNSERIALVFGNYGIDVIEKSPVRVSNLYSFDEAGKTCRTFAIVVFANEIPKALTPAYTKITGGASLGATLKQEGWHVTKKNLYFGEIEMGPRLKSLTRLTGKDSVTSAVHLYDLYAQSETQSVLFATIAEAHHPEFLSLDDLLVIYQDDAKNRMERNNKIERLLDVLARKMD